MNTELNLSIPGVDWNFSQYIRDNVMETLSGVKGENAVKIFGPNLEKLEEIAERVKKTLSEVRGIENVGIFRIKGQANLEFAIDRGKCACGMSVFRRARRAGHGRRRQVVDPGRRRRTQV